jgi:GDPmannose 4,6-dehydratase
MTKRALITGIAGQDGSYLAELLLSKAYDVWGVVGPQPSNLLDTARATAGIRLHLIDGNLMDMGSLLDSVDASQPDEVYNFAALSFVGDSWTNALETTEVNAVGALRLLEAIREMKPDARFCQASTAEMFGKVQQMPQTETTPVRPRSPYGVAKAYAHFISVNYRESYGMHASSAILFNHESPRRAIQFVTRKITDAVARIKLGLADELRLGNLDARRDWGFSGDYVEAMWLMLQQDEPDDYVVATGETHTVREFCEIAFDRVGLDWERYVVVDSVLFRPAEIDVLCGDASRARTILGWEPRVSFRELVEMMVYADMERLRASTNLH